MLLNYVLRHTTRKTLSVPTIRTLKPVPDISLQVKKWKSSVINKKTAMKQAYSFIISLCVLLYLSASCCEKNETEHDTHLHITGNSMPAFTHDSTSRTTSQETLPVAACISFFSTGDLEAFGTRLTWNGTEWANNQPLKWDNRQPAAEIKAYYPAETVENQVFYNENGELVDLLCAAHTCQSGKNISLAFQHQFARITFQFAPSFNRRIHAFTVTPSLLVASLNPVEQTFLYEPNDGETTHTLTVTPTGRYSLIIPSNCPLSLSLTVSTDDRVYEYTLSEQTYEAGVEYIHNLNSQQSGKGISSVEDFIAFTHLINGYEYENRSLDEFGETSEGKTIYYLLKDLTFTEEESSRVLEIGYRYTYTNARSFDDVFEGNYHSLSGLTLSGKSTDAYFSVFGYIGESGMVRNLVIKDLTISITDAKSTSLAGLVGFNKGTVDNCIVKNSTIESSSTEEIHVGGICCQNNSLIVNCKIDSFTVSGNTVKSAGIVYENNSGEAINCHINTFRSIQTLQAFQICRRSKSGKFANILCSDMSVSKFYYNFYDDAVISYCYYPSPTGITSSNSRSTDFIPYDEMTSLCPSGIDIGTALNQFTANYDYPLKQWITDERHGVTLNTYDY